MRRLICFLLNHRWASVGVMRASTGIYKIEKLCWRCKRWEAEL